MHEPHTQKRHFTSPDDILCRGKKKKKEHKNMDTKLAISGAGYRPPFFS